MPIGLQNLEWLNHNGQRNYPLAEEASAQDNTGTFKLPESFLLELRLPVHAGLDVEPGRFFIKHIGAYSTGYSIVVGYQPAAEDAEPVNVATALIARQTHVRHTSYALGGTGDFADSIGQVVIGDLDDINDQPPGFWTFDFDAGRLDTDGIVPIIRGVSSVIVVNGEQRSVPLYGDLEFAGGSNCQITPISVVGEPTIIRFSFLRGEGTSQDCVCEGDAAPTDPITRFNGLQPTPSGDFTIEGSECVEIEPIANGIRIKNRCAQPCCGPAELEQITQDLERLYGQVAYVEGYGSDLSTAVNTMRDVVLGARLSDRGCFVCE